MMDLSHPASTEANELVLTRVAWFFATRFEFAAISVLLRVWWHVLQCALLTAGCFLRTSNIELTPNTRRSCLVYHAACILDDRDTMILSTKRHRVKVLPSQALNQNTPRTYRRLLSTPRAIGSHVPPRTRTTANIYNRHDKDGRAWQFRVSVQRGARTIAIMENAQNSRTQACHE